MIYLIVFIGIGTNVFAREKSREELKGDRFYSSYSFDKAIDMYTQVKQLSLEGQRRLAESYHNTDQHVRSEAIYSGLLSASEGIVPEDYYLYAMSLRTNGKYGESSKWMDKFIALKPDDLRSKDYAAHKDELPGLLNDAGKYRIQHLSVNTDALDFGTSYFKDKIVFASSRAKPGVFARKYNWTGKPFWDMYISEIDGGRLKDPVIFDKNLNGKMNDGPASFSNDGTYMAFTRNSYNGSSKDKVVELQIYFSTCLDGKWSTPEPFVFNSREYSVGHPCLTSDGNVMYFASDMPGGYGGADIYKCTKDVQGAWGAPQNLGDKINTEGDEMFPFFEENDELLYFSSNGRFGLGGLDVFICAMDGPGYGSVHNVGFPLNSPYDDYAIIVNGQMSNGYFSSDRPGGSGGDDLYSFDQIKELDIPDPDVRFSINSPLNYPLKGSIIETFPLRNYVFFNIGSTEIPDRYVLMTKDQVKEFKEDQLEALASKNLSGRSARGMLIYHNLLNILGDRMGKDPTSSITLVGSSEQGPADGRAMAESVKEYLTEIFGIDASRIRIEGRDKPKIPSEQPGGMLELDLLREGDRRVSIETDSPALLMEFQSGPDAPLRPVEMRTAQEAPLDSYVDFYVEGANAALKSWSLEIRDERGALQSYGPYTNDRVLIPGKSILGVRPEGDFKVTMVGQTKSGRTVKKEASAHMVLWAPPVHEEGMRFSVIFEFNDSRAIMVYEKFLTEVVTPKIPTGGTVIIQGNTDITGDAAHNQTLSLARANEVRGIMEKALSEAGRTDVTFKVYGFGEDEKFSPFGNKLPEERSYNRTVIIDIN